jgi:D-alanyl-lipoteichoic acid acyltransferase DltB (MBOAT superfamily)
VGISFYTFQTLSYTIDVYQNKLKASKDFISFAAFVAFFPQLVAGPIERATNLVPQFEKKRLFLPSDAVNGLRQILWGFFSKMVIADNCAIYANNIFNNSEEMSGSMLVLGTVFFAFQIYGDFSGYSDIAIGVSRLFGFDLMKNFAFPYFSRDIAEFWRRWHISLSTWFKDYVYIPLGGSKVRKLIMVRNTFIVFLLSGFWHGANWTFIIWGALNAIYFLPLLLAKKNRRNLGIVAQNSKFPSLSEGIQVLSTFSLTLIAWIFFRAENLYHAISYIQGIISPSLFTVPQLPREALLVMTFTLLMLIIEWIGRHDEFGLEKFGLKLHRSLRWTFYLSFSLIIILFSGKEQGFIYFQF